MSIANSNNKWLKRYTNYCEYQDKAVNNYEYAERLLGLGRYRLAWTQVQWSWYNLLLSEEALYQAPPTARQKEAQRLWQQRGLLQ